LAPLGYALIAPFIKPRTHAGRLLDEQLEIADQMENEKS
ncbi:MAG: hypothetical protein ACJAS9_004072, partial [Polaribacter sp.]